MAARRVGEYLIISSLGEGTFGKVKLAVHEETGAQVALKIMEKSDILKQAFTINVRREIAIMKALTHKNIVKLHNVLTSEHKIYLVMEVVDGGELFALISNTSRGIPDNLARSFFHQLVDGVDYCHRRGVVHRDLKLENILISSSGDLKITDFGLSTIKGVGTTPELLKTKCGTPNYISPEVLENRSNGYDGKKLDVWSCGIILYALLVGYLPFDRTTPHEIITSIGKDPVIFPSWVSKGARDLINRMLEKNPKKRITLQDVKRHPWFAIGYISSPPPQSGRQPKRKKRAPRSPGGKVGAGAGSPSPPSSPQSLPVPPRSPPSRTSGKKKPRYYNYQSFAADDDVKRVSNREDDVCNQDRKEDAEISFGTIQAKRSPGVLRYVLNNDAKYRERTLGGEAEARRRGLIGNNSTLVIAHIDSQAQLTLTNSTCRPDVKPAPFPAPASVCSNYDHLGGVGAIRRIQTVIAVSKSGLTKEGASESILDVLLGKIEGMQIPSDAGSRRTNLRAPIRKMSISPYSLLDKELGGSKAFISALQYVRHRLAREINSEKSCVSRTEAEGIRNLLQLWENQVSIHPPVRERNNHDRLKREKRTLNLSKRDTLEIHVDWIAALQKLLRSWDQAVAGDDSAAEELDDHCTDLEETDNREDYSTEFDTDEDELDDIPGSVNVNEEVQLTGYTRTGATRRSARVSSDVIHAHLNRVGAVPKTESSRLREQNGVNEMTFMNRLPLGGVQDKGNLDGFFSDNSLDGGEVPTTGKESLDSKGGEHEYQNSSLNESCLNRQTHHGQTASTKHEPTLEAESVPTVSFDEIEKEVCSGRGRDHGPSQAKKNGKRTKGSQSVSRKAVRRSSRGSRASAHLLKCSPGSGTPRSDALLANREARSSRWLPFSGNKRAAQFNAFLPAEPCLTIMGNILQKMDCIVHRKRGELKLKCHVVLKQGKMTFTVDFLPTDVGGSTVLFKRVDRTLNRSLDSNTFKAFFNGVVNKFATVNTPRPPSLSAP